MSATSTVSLEEVYALARLANLNLDQNQAQQMQKELSAILDFVAQLNEVDTTDLEPTYQVTGLTNVMREDELIDYQVTPEDLLKNAPAAENGSLKVKRVL